MNISTAQIQQSLADGFVLRYRPFSAQVGTPLWDVMYRSLDDPRFVNSVIFANDNLGVPPVKSFLLSHTLPVAELTKPDRQFIGAFWGYIFQFVFLYKDYKRASCNVQGVGTAARFTKPPQGGVIVE